ncbi:MAG: Hsp70 family protein [Deltaproteobacteria bacterium]|nr:Hsp70 family protein [Deltaproteobacteria bacterium]
MEALPEATDEQEVTIGIDLGTTNSVVACARKGKVEVIPDKDGNRLHPSVVAFKPSGERIVGAAARVRRIIDPANTVFSAKRIIGQPFNAPKVQEVISTLPYRVVAGDNEEPIVVTRAGRFPVIDVSSFVLSYLREVAEAHLGCRVSNAVITVPAHFSDGQREATRLAAERAGLNVLRLLNEPTAAALAYGLGRRLNQRIVIYDMGGGTFDVTLLAARENLFEVIATGGDPYLGGDDMDRSLAKKLAEDFLMQHRYDISLYADEMARLLLASENIKQRLSQEQVAQGKINDLAHGLGGAALSLEFNLPREDLEDLISPLVDRSLMLVEKVLSEANQAARLVDDVILVGGATKIPAIRQRVAEHFGRAPRTDINPMEVVAAGAALQANFLLAPPVEAETNGFLLMDVTSHGLGVATAGGYADLLVEKNTPIPVEKTRVFTTATDGQTSVLLKICEGEEKRFDSNKLLGTLRLDGLRPAARGQVRVEVSFVLDADGTLQVSARDLDTNREERATLSVLGIGTQQVSKAS